MILCNPWRIAKPHGDRLLDVLIGGLKIVLAGDAFAVAKPRTHDVDREQLGKLGLPDQCGGVLAGRSHGRIVTATVHCSGKSVFPEDVLRVGIPEGWTDVLTIPLPPGQTVEAIGRFVMQHDSKSSGEDIVQAIVTTFGITCDDAALVCDRVSGGILRAAFGNAANRPDPAKDPVAYFSYERARRDRGTIVAIRPEHAQAPKRSWWQFWR